MGNVISDAANSIGGALGNALLAPFKTIFNASSCEDVCAGPWNVICFIEHLCVFNLIKLLMILVLCYIILLLCYLLFKVGICQCIVRSLCKMCWGACETYWYALEDIICFCWHKLKNTKRRNRRRRRPIPDIESGHSSDDGSYFPNKYSHLSSSRKQYRERKKWYDNGSHHRRHHHHVRGGSIRLKNSRRLQLMKVRNRHRISKRRRFR